MIRRLLLAFLLLLPFEADAVISVPNTPTFAGSGTAPTITLPTNGGNDVILLFVKTSNESIAAPSGYTEIDTQANLGTGTGATAGSVRMAVFWKRIAPGNSDVTQALADSGDDTMVTAVVVHGCITTGNPYDVYGGAVQATTNTAVSWQSAGATYSNGSTLTTTVPGTLVMGAIANATDLVAAQGGAEACNTLNNVTEIADNNNTSNLGGGMTIMSGYHGAGVIVDTGSNNMTATLGTSSKYVMFIVAMKPDAASGPLYIGSTVSVNSAAAISTLTLPAGLSTNDITVLVVESSAQTITAPSGYTEIDTQASMTTGSAAGVGSVQMAVFYKRYVGGDTAPTVADSGDHQIAQIFGFTNVITSGNPYDVLGVAVNGTASATPDWATGTGITYGTGAGTVTSTVANALVLTILANGNDTTTLQTTSMACAQLSGYLQIGDANCTNGTGGGFGVAAGELAAAGNIVNTSTHSFGATLVTSASKYAMAVIALKPPVTGITAQQKAGFFMLMR